MENSLQSVEIKDKSDGDDILKYLQKRRKMGWCIYCNISKVQSDSRLHKKPTDPTPTSFSPAPPAWPPPTATFSPESLQLPRGYVLLGELCFAWKAVFCFWQLCLTLQSVHLEGCVFLRELCFTLPASCVLLRKLCFSLQGVFHSEDCVLLRTLSGSPSPAVLLLLSPSKPDFYCCHPGGKQWWW